MQRKTPQHSEVSKIVWYSNSQPASEPWFMRRKNLNFQAYIVELI